MDKVNTLQFLNKECKTNQHSKCHTRWEGLAVEVVCRCDCHKRKDAVIAFLQTSTSKENDLSYANREWYSTKTGKVGAIDG
jgi:hypothetical protein